MARNASLFELNMQQVVKMLERQYMPFPVTTLASVIAIRFVGSKRLPVN
jgi:energy-coupling factor transporter transmembrane protein EcfT